MLWFDYLNTGLSDRFALHVVLYLFTYSLIYLCTYLFILFYHVPYSVHL